jgi:hypothetical protein
MSAQVRLLRNYHGLPPGRFHPLNQRIRTCLTDNPNIPLTVWASNPELLSLYFALCDKFEPLFHESHFRNILVIAQRDAIQKELVIYLDEIASILEAAAVRNPDILLSCGFDIAKERRSTPRAKKLATQTDASHTEQHEDHR